MIQVTPAQMAQIAPLYQGQDETMIQSCLQGMMGSAQADRLPQPRAARIDIGDFCFLAGDAQALEARELVLAFPAGFSGEALLMVPPDREWEKLIQECHAGSCQRVTRYAFEQQADFSREKLMAFRDALPKGYRLEQIDGERYGQAIRQKWSADLCSQFESCQDYLQRGLGFCVLYGKELVCGASSYTVYRGGLEIQIDTREDHQRRGLARACAAALILECLKRGIFPSWDAANLPSRALAEQLGYRFRREYPVYAVENPHQPLHS